MAFQLESLQTLITSPEYVLQHDEVKITICSIKGACDESDEESDDDEDEDDDDEDDDEDDGEDDDEDMNDDRKKKIKFCNKAKRFIVLKKIGNVSELTVRKIM